MGKRKGKKSSKSRRKRQRIEKGSDNREEIDKGGRSRQLIFNSHGFGNMPLISNTPYLPPQTMQRMVSDKIALEQQRLRNLDEQLVGYNSQIQQIRTNIARKEEEVRQARRDYEDERRAKWDRKKARLKEEKKFMYRMRKLDRDDEEALDKLRDEKTLHYAQQEHDDKIQRLMAKNARDINIQNIKNQTRNTLAFLKNDHQEKLTALENDDLLNTEQEHNRSDLAMTEDKLRTKKRLQKMQGTHKQRMAQMKNQAEIDKTNEEIAHKEALQNAEIEKNQNISTAQRNFQISSAIQKNKAAERQLYDQLDSNYYVREADLNSQLAINSMRNQYDRNIAEMNAQFATLNANNNISTNQYVQEAQRYENLQREMAAAQRQMNDAAMGAELAIQREKIKNATSEYQNYIKNMLATNLDNINALGTFRLAESDAIYTQQKVMQTKIQELEHLQDFYKNSNNEHYQELTNMVKEMKDFIKQGQENGTLYKPNYNIPISTPENITQPRNGPGGFGNTPELNYQQFNKDQLIQQQNNYLNNLNTGQPPTQPQLGVYNQPQQPSIGTPDYQKLDVQGFNYQQPTYSQPNPMVSTQWNNLSQNQLPIPSNQRLATEMNNEIQQQQGEINELSEQTIENLNQYISNQANTRWNAMNGTQTESNYNIIGQMSQNKFNGLKYYLQNHGKKNEKILRDTVENDWQDTIYSGIDMIDRLYREKSMSGEVASNLASLLMEQLHKNYHLNPSNQRSKEIQNKYIQMVKDANGPIDTAMQYLNPDILKPSFDYDEILSLIA